MVLGQQATDDKSNEITGIPKLLALLEPKGCIVTIDAMGCQRAIAEQVIDQQSDYVLGFKGNQGMLHDAVDDFFPTAQANTFKGVSYDYAEELDKGHGRIETRRYWISDVLASLPKQQQWKGLRSIGLVERECLENGTISIERLNSSIQFLPMPSALQLPSADIGGLKIHCIGAWMSSLGMTRVAYEKAMQPPL